MMWAHTGETRTRFMCFVLKYIICHIQALHVQSYHLMECCLMQGISIKTTVLTVSKWTEIFFKTTVLIVQFIFSHSNGIDSRKFV